MQKSRQISWSFPLHISFYSYALLETDAEDPEPRVLHHHGRGSSHPGSPQEQLRDPDYAAEAGHLAPPAPRCRLRVHALQR